MDNIGEFSSLLTAFSVFIAATGIVLAVFQFVRYDRRAKESLQYIQEREFVSEYERLRENLEAEIADLHSKLTDTQAEFLKVNHLAVEGQEAIAQVDGQVVLKQNSFLKGLNLGEVEQDKSLIFVLTPFHKREQMTYSAIVEAFDGFEVKVRRGDERHSDNILQHIVEQIAKSRLIIANISSRNPNVMYELGISHALGKSVILISNARDADVPFDLRHTRIIFYNTRADLVSKLREEVARRFFS